MSENIPENERPRQERSSDMTAGLVVGLALILIGGLFLLSNFGLLRGFNLPQNWWALFFLIPIVATAASLIRKLQINGGRFTRDISGHLIGILVLGLLMAIFLLGLNWGKVWPAFLILAGLGALASALTRE